MDSPRNFVLDSILGVQEVGVVMPVVGVEAVFVGTHQQTQGFPGGMNCNKPVEYGQT